MFRLEKFELWRKAIDFAGEIYRITAHFPTDERFGLTSQMRRAGVAISSNVAEGGSRASDADFARCAEIAYGSLWEVVSQSFVAKQQCFLSEDDFQHLDNTAEDLAGMLSALKSRLTH